VNQNAETAEDQRDGQGQGQPVFQEGIERLLYFGGIEKGFHGEDTPKGKAAQAEIYQGPGAQFEDKTKGTEKKDQRPNVYTEGKQAAVKTPM
jgi:hypothetical protein